jgi:hypothetical protein
MVTNSGAESRYFDQLSGVNCEIFPGITFGNHHEGSIPFTRSNLFLSIFAVFLVTVIRVSYDTA